MVKLIARKGLNLLLLSRTAQGLGEPFFWLFGLRHMPREIALSQVKRVLVIRLDEIGDVVMTTPFLRELRRNLPDAWITLVVKPAVYNLVELCPYVNEILTYDWNTSRPLKEFKRHYKALTLAVKHLWKRRFDLAILPRWDVDYYHGTFLLYFSGAPRRVGYSEKVSKSKRNLNRGYDRLLTHHFFDDSLKHEVQHNLQVIRYIGGYVRDDRLELWLSGEDKIFADEFLNKHGVKPKDLLVAFAPGASTPKKMWPIKRFAEIGSWLRELYGAKIVVIGGPGEELLGEELEQVLGRFVVNAIGKTTLRQSAALLSHCRLFVGNDSGPMHIAAALGVPVVELSWHAKSIPRSSHLQSPLRFGPWGIDHVVLQPKTPKPPCIEECTAKSPHCILEISVQETKGAISKQLSLAGFNIVKRRVLGT